MDIKQFEKLLTTTKVPATGHKDGEVKIENTVEWNESVQINCACFSRYKNSLGPVS